MKKYLRSALKRLKRAAIPGLIAAALGCGATLALLSNRSIRNKVYPPRLGPALPGVESLVVRRGLIAKRDDAVQRGDLVAAARVHGVFASESVRRARAVYDAWMPLRDADTTLFPESVDKAQWNYRNVAADFFCFQLHVGMYTQAACRDLLFETLAHEADLGDSNLPPLPRWVDDGSVVLFSSEHPTFGGRGPIFGASEYVKDGLMSLYEATGDARVYRRMVEVTDAIIAHSNHRTRFGPIPSGNPELNGEMLQSLARIARLESDARYAEMLQRIADAVIEMMLPANRGLPCRSFDYSSGTVQDSEVSLRDHGNELLPGLAEAFAFAVDYSHEEPWRERAERWVAPLAAMFEAILREGVREDGLLVSSFDAQSLKFLSGGPNDNWGYIAAGALLFADRAEWSELLPPDRVQAIRESVRSMSHAVAATDRLSWEGVSHDGYADSLESAMLVAAHDVDAAKVLAPWIDDQMGVMFAMQRPDGFISGGYLDGNFMRTALMYADMRSGGWVLDPWDEHTSVGLATHDGRAVLYVTGKPGVTYTLRHRSAERGFRDVFNRPAPRLNSWPDWADPNAFAAEAKGHEEPQTTEVFGDIRVTVPSSGWISLVANGDTDARGSAD